MTHLSNHRVFPVPLMIDAGDQRASLPDAAIEWARREPLISDVPIWITLESDDPTHAGDEAYDLILGERCVIRSRSDRGIRLALSTLRQLILDDGCTLRRCRITDAPKFRHRGVMLDVSRDRVPRMDFLLEFVATLASLKINHLQLYTEHTFMYAGHDDVWRDWSPITPEDVRTLDAACAAYGITLAANQNCFGHLASWLKLPRYEPMAETTGTWKFMEWDRSGAFSLCPIDPRSIEFVDELLAQLLPCFSSGIVNINCDETFDVGQGRSRAEVAARGRGAVYASFVRQIVELVERRGFRAQFWADIALHEPESLALLPKSLTALAWGYEPDSPFDRWGETLQRDDRAFWVCPGTSSWRSITGRTSERRENMRFAIDAGLRSGAEGVLITDWGDGGHLQQWPISLHGIARGADAAWRGETSDDSLALESRRIFGDSSERVAAWLDALGDIDLDLRAVWGTPSADGRATRLKNASVIHTDMTEAMEVKPRGTRDNFEIVAARIDGARSTTPQLTDARFTAEIQHTLAHATFACSRATWRRSGDVPDSRRAASLTDELRALIESHRRLWLERSRPGGLDHSCTFLSARLPELERCQ